MRYNNIVKRGATFTATSFTSFENTDTIELYKYTDALYPIYAPASYNFVVSNGFKQLEIRSPDEDCLLLLKWGKIIEVVRCGNPPLYAVVYDEGGTPSIKQYGLDCTLLDSAQMIGVGANFFIYSPLSIEPSFLVFDDRHIVTLTLPLAVISSSVRLQPNVWQLLAIPIRGNIKEVFIDKLEATTGSPASQHIKIINTFFGDENLFRTFIPNQTNPLSSNNFPLVYNDNGYEEVTGFWVKTLDTFTDPIVLEF